MKKTSSSRALKKPRMPRHAQTGSRRQAPAPAAFLILGGYGRAGTLLAEYLLRETSLHLILAGRNADKAEQAAERLRSAFPGRTITARRADAMDAASLRNAFSGVRMVIVASTTPASARTVATAAIECGADYLDIQYGRAKTEALRTLAPEIVRHGRFFVTEAGFHPGLPSALVRYAAAALERFDKATVASIANMKAEGPMPLSMVELVEMFQHYDSRVFRSGRWAKDEGAGLFGLHEIDFREPFGVRKCSPMAWDELLDLPTSIPSLRELTSYVAGFHPITDTVIIPLILISLTLFKDKARLPMAKLLFWSLKVFPPKPVGTALVMDAHGDLSGMPVSLTLSVAHHDEYVITAIPVVATILQYLKGTIGKPGLWMMGHVVEPYSFVTDLGRMGLDLSLKLR